MSHTTAFRLPRPCEFDKTLMDRMGNGILCPKCGHKLFDPGEEQTCDCARCSKKWCARFSLGMLSVSVVK